MIIKKKRKRNKREVFDFIYTWQREKSGPGKRAFPMTFIARYPYPPDPDFANLGMPPKPTFWEQKQLHNIIIIYFMPTPPPSSLFSCFMFLFIYFYVTYSRENQWYVVFTLPPKNKFKNQIACSRTTHTYFTSTFRWAYHTLPYLTRLLSV